MFSCPPTSHSLSLPPSPAMLQQAPPCRWDWVGPHTSFCLRASLTLKWGMFGRTPPSTHKHTVRKCETINFLWAALDQWKMESWWVKYSTLPFLGWTILIHIPQFLKDPKGIEIHLPPKVTKLRTQPCKDPGRENPGRENQKISQKKNMMGKLKDMESSPRSSHIHLTSAAERIEKTGKH